MTGVFRSIISYWLEYWKSLHSTLLCFCTTIKLGNKGFAAWDSSWFHIFRGPTYPNTQSCQNFSHFGFLCENRLKYGQKPKGVPWMKTFFFSKSSQNWIGIFKKLWNFLLTPKTYYVLKSDPYNIMNASWAYTVRLKLKFRESAKKFLNF